MQHVLLWPVAEEITKKDTVYLQSTGHPIEKTFLLKHGGSSLRDCWQYSAGILPALEASFIYLNAISLLITVNMWYKLITFYKNC
jgi:hypothetical protein